MKRLGYICVGVVFCVAAAASAQTTPEVARIAQMHGDYVTCIKNYVTKLATAPERASDIADAGLGNCQRERGGFVQALFDSRLYSFEQSQSQARAEDVNLRRMALSLILSAREKAAGK